MHSWPQVATDLSAQLKNLRGGVPDVMKAFAGIAHSATIAKALDAKTKELIALGISVAVRCDDCIAFHAKAAVERGASREEVLETLGMAIYMGAGPSVMYASHALEAFSQFAAARAPGAGLTFSSASATWSNPPTALRRLNAKPRRTVWRASQSPALPLARI